MNAITEKLIIPLDDRQMVHRATPLKAIYLIHDTCDERPHRRPAVRTLSPACALPKILAATASHYAFEPDRLKRQFEFVTRLVRKVSR